MAAFIIKSIFYNGNIMKIITIRNILDDLYRVIIRIAKRNRRSIQQQMLTIIERARILDTESPVEKAMQIRKRFSGRKRGNTVEEIREERNRWKLLLWIHLHLSVCVCRMDRFLMVWRNTWPLPGAEITLMILKLCAQYKEELLWN